MIDVSHFLPPKEPLSARYRDHIATVSAVSTLKWRATLANSKIVFPAPQMKRNISNVAQSHRSAAVEGGIAGRYERNGVGDRGRNAQMGRGDTCGSKGRVDGRVSASVVAAYSCGNEVTV